MASGHVNRPTLQAEYMAAPTTAAREPDPRDVSAFFAGYLDL